MKRSIASLAFLLFPIVPAAAQELQPYDAASRGLGNAGAADGGDLQTFSFNPAELARGSKAPLEFVNAGFGISAYGFSDIGIEGDILGAVDRVTDLYNELGGGTGFSAVQSRLNSGTATAQDLRDAVSLIESIGQLDEDGTGVIGNVGGGIDLRLGSFGIFYRDVTYAGLDPFVNLGGVSALTDDSLAVFFGQFAGGALSAAGSSLATRLRNETTLDSLDNDADGTLDANELAFQAQQSIGDAGISDPAFQTNYISVVNATVANAGTGNSANTLFSNGSGVVFSGIRMRETGISAGFPLHLIAFPGVPSLNVGITVKEIIAETFREVVTLQNLQDGKDTLGDLIDNRNENTERSNKINFDLGLSVSPLPDVTFGLTAKNLIPMDFDVKGTSEDFEVDPQLRLGVSANPFGILKIALDLDLLESEFDGLEGFESRIFAGGLELNLLPVKIRAGIFDNLASAESGIVYSGGLGLSLLGLALDVNGQISGSKVDVETGSSLTDSVSLPERVSLAVTLGFNVRF